MKLNDENYEWIMVELLEGNLSRKDELSVMEQIEEDEFFFKQWNLFKQTIIQTDQSLKFHNKASLLKPEVLSRRRIIPFLGVAASIIFGIMVIVFWPSKLSDNELVRWDKPIDIQSIEKPILEHKKVVHEVEKAIHETYFESNQSSNLLDSIEQVVFLKSTEKTNKTIPIIEDSKERNDKIVHFLEDKFLVVDHPDAPDYIAVQQMMNRGKLLKNELPLELKTGGKLIAFVTNHPIRRIRNKTNNIVQKMKNPNLKIKPKFEGRNSTLDIHFESEGYIAMAYFQPFKNKN